ncbi:MAG: SPASM domain-containing protein, partial [Candidatus Korarchaeota archaeon]|nr:SPASM domain-containing protein [Candidatus Korarchaeota archaeon]
GRGALLREEVPSKEEWRSLLDWFIDEMILGDAQGGAEIDIGLHPSTAIYVMEKLREKGYDTSSAEERMRTRRLSVEGRGFISISPTGDVYLSNYLTDFRLGNALQDDLRELLNHPLYRSAGDSSQLRGRCGSCPYRDMCGGSRVKAYIYTGDLLGEDPTCLIQD